MYERGMDLCFDRATLGGWGLDGQKDEIHSFPTMYIMGGGG